MHHYTARVTRVQLERDWTDDQGVAHHAGDIVTVDRDTLARLERDGVVRPADDQASEEDWTGPTAGPEVGDEDW